MKTPSNPYLRKDGMFVSKGSKLLVAKLGRGWVIEFKVPDTGRFGPVDIAHPYRMIAIEVDAYQPFKSIGIGASKRKEKRLRELGWDVYRVLESDCCSRVGRINLHNRFRDLRNSRTPAR